MADSEPRPEEAPLLGCLEWQSHLETRSPRLGFKGNLSAMGANDSVDGVQAYPGAFAHSLRRKEWLKHMRLYSVGNTGSIVDNLNENVIEFSGSSNFQHTLAAHGIDGVVNQIGPDLVQLAPAREDPGKREVVIALHIDAAF